MRVESCNAHAHFTPFVMLLSCPYHVLSLVMTFKCASGFTWLARGLRTTDLLFDLCSYTMFFVYISY
jgi:hypothetical protein